MKPTARTLRSQLGLNSILTVLLVLVLLVGVNYVSYRYYHRTDFSKGSYYRLSDVTVQTLKQLPEPIQITSCLATSRMRTEIETLLHEYKYRGGNKVNLEFVDPAVDLSRAEELAKKYSLNAGSENVVIFEYKDRHKVLNDSDLADFTPMNPFTGQPPEMKDFKGEAQFTAAIQSLVEGKTSIVYFLTGHGERNLGDLTNPGGYGTLNVYLKRGNMAPTPLNLAGQPGIPADADALVIAGPRSPLSPNEVQAVANYLNAKGKVILLQDPQTLSGLEPTLQHYGILLQDDKILAALKMAGASILIHTATGTTYADNPIVRPLHGLNIKMDNARSLALVKDPANPNVAKVTSLIQTPSLFWGETNFTDPKPQYDAGTDIAGPLTLAMVYDGGNLPGESVKVAGTRLEVAGSSTFLTNEKIDEVGLDFFLNTLNWMMQKESSIGIAPKAVQEFGLSVTPLQRSTIILLSLLFAPSIAVIAGGMVWFSRRR